MTDKKEMERLNRIARDGETRYQIESVPSLVVDGKVLLGEDQAGWPALQTTINALLAKQPPAKHPAVKKAKPRKKK